MTSDEQEQSIESKLRDYGLLQEADAESLQSESSLPTNADGEAIANNRRNWFRYKLALPAQVTGYDQIDGQWQEVTQTIDVSRSGALICLHKRVRHQTLLHISLPLPAELRFYQHEAPLYEVYALIIRIEPSQEGKRLVAVEFIGQSPPPGFMERPWNTYRTKWNRVERRREPRHELYEPVMVEYFDEAMQVIKREVAVTENVSAGGTRLCAKAVPFDFTWVKVSCADPQFESYAVVCNRYSSEDGVERLCLRFLDNAWPI